MRVPNHYQEQDGCDGVNLQLHSVRLTIVTSYIYSFFLFSFLNACIYLDSSLILCSFYPASSAQCAYDELNLGSHVLIGLSGQLAE